jgi:glycosyltransferase involved in cell wall biosynthesis
MNAPFPHVDLTAGGAPHLAPDVDGASVATVALIVPIHNEEAAIAPFLEAVYRNTEMLTEQGVVFEFFFVNDGSTDATLDCLLLAQQEDPRIRVIDLSRSFGREAAMTAGLDLCDADAAIPIGVDLRDPPHVIPLLVDKWREGYDVVLAKRAVGSRNIVGNAAGSLLQRLRDLVPDRHIPHGVGEFRLIDRQVVDALRGLPERRRYMKGLFAWVGFSTASVDYVGEPDLPRRASGGRLKHFVREGLASFSTAPLEIWTNIGAGIASLAFLYGLAIIANTLIVGSDVPGYASLMVSILFLGGIQLLGIGVLGQYLANVHAEIKQRPVYLVRQTFGVG